MKTDKDGPLGCGDTKQYYKRTKALAAHLRTSSWWKRHNGRDFIILNSFYWIKDAVGIEMMTTLLRGPAIFTSSDKNYLDFEAINDTVVPTIIPYKAHYRLEDAAWLALDGRSRYRKHTLMFRGSTTRGTKRGYTEGELRGEICNQLGPAVEHTNLRCVSTTWWPARPWTPRTSTPLRRRRPPLMRRMCMSRRSAFPDKMGGQKKVSAEGYHEWVVPEGRMADPKTLRAYTNAKICLIPAGDTPTSRRLFDAMAAGCVPLLLAPYEDIMPNLPFPKAIDWPETVLFGGSLSCSLRDRVNETIRWVQSFSSPRTNRSWNVWAGARSAFAKYLSHRDEGPVSGILHELKHDRRYHKMLMSAPLVPQQAASRQMKVALPSTASSCDSNDQCGCLGTATTTFYIRYHKTGCVLTRQIMDEIDGHCAIRSHSVQPDMTGDTPAAILAAADLAGKRCNNLKVALDGNNLMHYTDEVLERLTRPREGVRFVHMLREPLRLVASYYAYHTGGAIGGETPDHSPDDPVLVSFQHNLTQMSLAEGLAVVAKLVAEEQLPAMAKAHDHLMRSGRDDVLEMRMEEFEANFNETIGSLLSHTRVSAECAAKGQPLFNALAKHDVSRFTAEQLARDNHISHRSVGDGSGPNLEDKALHELLTGNKALRASLKDFGKRLGYTYPEDKPADTFKEAEARQSASDKLVKDAAIAALGHDEGLSHREDLSPAFTSHLQGSQRLRPRILHLSGCSESSAVMRTVRTFWRYMASTLTTSFRWNC